ncbi:MAG TPA: 30S ribosome-binding factor RbfA [Bryobacteraceae bacterium]|nr:30S ribosome-binding factor RbfA [Bryobacteraceae bacterium]
MDPRRAAKVAETLREELEELIGYELTDPRIQANVGVSEVLLSPDGRRARVRLILAGTSKEQSATLEAVEHARGFLRRELAQRIDIFRIPELHFEAAVGAGLGARLEHLMKRVKKGRPRTEASPENGAPEAAGRAGDPKKVL